MGKNKGYLDKLEPIHIFFKKHWFWYTILVSTPSIWFSAFLPYAGKHFNLIKEDDNSITTVGLVLTIFLVCLVVILVFLNSLYTKYKEETAINKKDGEIQYLYTINESIDNICDEKLSILKSKIVEEKSTKKEYAPIITNPKNQIKRIIMGITECLVKLLNNKENNFKYKDFLVTVIYRFPQEEDDNWKWLDGVGDGDGDIECLLKDDCNSTFNYLIKTNKSYYFNNSKEDAQKTSNYVFTPNDKDLAESNEPVGSIFCYRYKIDKTSKVFIDAIISISTSKKRFSKENREICSNVKDNMLSLVKDVFGKRIRIELSLLYLEHLNKIEDKK